MAGIRRSRLSQSARLQRSRPSDDHDDGGYDYDNGGYDYDNGGYDYDDSGYDNTNAGYDNTNAGYDDTNTGYDDTNTGCDSDGRCDYDDFDGCGDGTSRPASFRAV